MSKFFLGKLFSGKSKSKVSPTITKVEPNVPKTKGQKLKRDLKLATQKTKASQAKLDKAIFDLQEQNRQFKKDRVKKMGGGMMGRRFGMKSGTPKPKTNVEKIKEAFGSKKGLKKIDPKKQKGLAKLKKARPDVVRKMGYFKKGGRS